MEEEEKRKRAEEEAAAAQDAAAASQDADSDMMGADTEDNTSQDPSGKKQGKKATKKKGNKKASTRKSSKKPAQQNGSDLTTKVRGLTLSDIDSLWKHPHLSLLCPAWEAGACWRHTDHMIYYWMNIPDR